jgi:DNA-binding response OmpR family regulator
VRALLRRAAAPLATREREEVVERGELRIDLPRRAVEVRGEPVQLTFIEFEMLVLLASSPGVVFSRRELLERLRGGADYREPRTIDVHVRHLREKIERDPGNPELILTIRGAGYRFRPE